MIMWWLQRGKTCNSRFVRKTFDPFYIFLLKHYLLIFFNGFSKQTVNETESRLVPPPLPHRSVDMVYSDSKSQMLHSLISSSEKHAVADQTVLPSTRPTCPRWRPPRRRARSGPPHGRSAPPLSWFQQRGAGMTSCCSSSFAARRPPTVGRRWPLLRFGTKATKANVCGWRWWRWK